jgi:tRNA wybutosine-synthesizing protein 4
MYLKVMANVLCQIQGSKRLLLFPPSDVRQFQFEAGASSSSINAFDNLEELMLAGAHPREAQLGEGDILFIPPFWLHTASPTSGLSVAVNVFFRDLKGYAFGSDVYGNRDLQAYEKGRQDLERMLRPFDSLPTDARNFYLQRLVEEMQQKI